MDTTAPPLHLGKHRREVNDLSPAELTRLDAAIHEYVSGPANPVAEHAAAGPTIHGTRFLAWHYWFVGKLEDWLTLTGRPDLTPLPYWNPALSIPEPLSHGNVSPAIALPEALRPGPIATIANYVAMNSEIVGFHDDVHMKSGGDLPNALVSPGDPIFWPFHAFLVAVYEHWRSH